MERQLGEFSPDVEESDVQLVNGGTAVGPVQPDDSQPCIGWDRFFPERQRKRKTIRHHRTSCRRETMVWSGMQRKKFALAKDYLSFSGQSRVSNTFTEL